MTARRSYLGVGLLVFIVYVVSPVSIQTDSIWSIPTAASLLHQGNMELDEFRPTFASYTHHGVLEFRGRTYYDYPMGAVLAAAPFLALFDALTGLAPPTRRLQEWHQHFHQEGDVDLGFFNRTERWIASFYVSAAAAVVFLTARRRSSFAAALVVALLFGLGTAAYSTGSRVLWQHAPSLLAVALIVHLASKPEQTLLNAAMCGLTVALSYVCRPTHAVTVVVISTLFALRGRRLLLAYLLAAACVAIPFCLYNTVIYGKLLSPYYQQGLDIQSGRFAIGLAANLVSPSRGLFVYSPFLLLAVGSLLRNAFARRLDGAATAFAIALTTHWVAVSAFPTWWAGHAYGARFMTDVLPYLAYFLLEPVATILSRPRPTWLLGLGAAAAFSFFIHARASSLPQVWRWNDGPPDVNDAPMRVWDWRDAEFLR